MAFWGWGQSKKFKDEEVPNLHIFLISIVYIINNLKYINGGRQTSLILSLQGMQDETFRLDNPWLKM